MTEEEARTAALAAVPALRHPSPATVRTELRAGVWWCWQDSLVAGTDRDAVLVDDEAGWVVRYPAGFAAFGVAAHLDEVRARITRGVAPQAALDEVGNAIAVRFVVGRDLA
ncbi:MAG: hypothetical protein ACLGIR_06540 [Actinomycetes bacterium]